MRKENLEKLTLASLIEGKRKEETYLTSLSKRIENYIVKKEREAVKNNKIQEVVYNNFL